MYADRVSAAVCLLAVAPAAIGQVQQGHEHHPSAPLDQSAATSRHIPPDPPSHLMEPMSNAQMAEVMAMDDAARYGAVVIDQLEWREHTDTLGWKATAWYGGDYNKLILKTEGAYDDEIEHARTEALWDHAISRWWSLADRRAP